MESPILSSAQMRDTEDAAFSRGVKVEALMDEAGRGAAGVIAGFFPEPAKCIVYAGKGHNGGDALVAAAWLKRAGWDIDIRLAYPEEDCSELTRKKLQEARDVSAQNPPRLGRRAPLLVLDGLLGLGAKELLREPIRSCTKAINRLRQEESAHVFALDIPTGVNGDTGETDPEDPVAADCTIAIGYAKHGLIVDPSLDLVGRIEVVNLPDLTVSANVSNESLATAQSLRSSLPRRKFSSYKNQFGRIGIIAGSEGLIGAGALATRGAASGGGGLIEWFVPREIHAAAAAIAPPEAMVKPVKNFKDLLDREMDVWAVGPGLGKDRASEVLRLIERAKQPMVVDADGLNLVTAKPDLLKGCDGLRLLTPHPGEMSRLFDAGKMSRAGIVRNFCDQYPVTLLLKGSRTIVGERGRPLSYNSTGNPGMATGGMGDALTGVCAGLLGRGLAAYDAARIAAWACGRASDIAVYRRNESEESLLPTNMLACLGEAFNELRDPLG